MNAEQLLALLQPSETALQFFTRKRQKPLYTGIDPLDECNEGPNGFGGLVAGDIVEVYGNSGSGASQICYTACVNAVLPFVPVTQDQRQPSSTQNREMNVLWIDLDLKFDEIKLTQMLEERVLEMAQVDEKLAALLSEDATDELLQFIHHQLSRVKVIQPQNAFSFWMTMESFLQNEKEKQQFGIVESQHDSFGLIIVDSLSGTWFNHPFHRKDWERACDSLSKLATQHNIPLIATVRENKTKEARKKYRKDLLEQTKRNRELLSDEQRIVEEMFILHLDQIMPTTWKDRINYRLLLSEDEQALYGGYFAALSIIDQNNPLKNRRAQRPAKLFKFTIQNKGVIFEKTTPYYE